MPIYEYRCTNCQRRTSIYWKSYKDAGSESPACPRCGAQALVRTISRVAVLRSEESRLDDLADPSTFSGLDEDDPKSIARWMRKMGQEVGEDLGPEFSEVVDRLESGQSPDEVEQAVPGLAGDTDAGEPSLDL